MTEALQLESRRMTIGKSVMLAPNETVGLECEHIKWPMLASYKIDGQRGIIIDGQMYSRSLKPLKNLINWRYRALIEAAKSAGLILDGELYSKNYEFSDLMSILRKETTKVPKDVKFHVFDAIPIRNWRKGEGLPGFQARVKLYREFAHSVGLDDDLVAVKQWKLDDPELAQHRLTKAFKKGYEGLMLRSLHSEYKRGRATLKEGSIFKFKDIVTSDAVIIGFEQGTKMSDSYRESKRGRNEDGSKKRSTKKETRVPVNRIGSVVVRTRDGIECGVGFAKGVRKKLEAEGLTWSNRGEWVGRWVEVRHMEHGAKDKLRFGGIVRMRPDLEGT